MITLSEARTYAPNLTDIADARLTGIIEYAHHFISSQYVLDTTMTDYQKYAEAVVTQYFATQHGNFANPFQSESLGDWSYNLKEAKEELKDILEYLQPLPPNDSTLPAIEKFNFRDWNLV